VTRVLVLGGEGMLGHKMFQTLGAHFAETYCTMRGQPIDETYRGVALLQGDSVIAGVDATDFGNLERLLADLGPTEVVNCIGVVKQRPEAHDAIPSITLNSLLPHHLAAMAVGVGARVIHFSTDCVFNGSKGAYREDDPSDAEDLYGRTKYLGEVAGPNSLTLRTSIIGRDLFEDLSLVDWFVSQAGKRVRGYARTLYTGLTTTALSREISRVIEDHPRLEGLYHVSSAPITKYDLLVMLDAALHTGTTVERNENEVSDRSLVSDRYWQATGGRPPSWPAMVAELAADPTDYAAFRRLKR
jgi:dTDP-4-dehydrorhamnose reductase